MDDKQKKEFCQTVNSILNPDDFDYWYQGEKPSYDNTVKTSETIDFYYRGDVTVSNKLEKEDVDLSKVDNKADDNTTKNDKSYQEVLNSLLENDYSEDVEEPQEDEKIKQVKSPENVILNLKWDAYININKCLDDYNDLVYKVIEEFAKSKNNAEDFRELSDQLKEVDRAKKDFCKFMMINQIKETPEPTIIYSNYKLVNFAPYDDKFKYINVSNDIETIQDLKKHFTPMSIKGSMLF